MGQSGTPLREQRRPRPRFGLAGDRSYASGIAHRVGLGLMSAAICGCATSSLHKGRADFYRSDPVAAATTMETVRGRHGNRVLFLMERGMARHVAGDYAASSADWNEAVALITELETYSLSRGAASFVINDRTKAFRGALYEQALLHAFNAKNYFAQRDWDGAAVEARLLVDKLGDLNGFPDEPYSRYVAATAFLMIENEDSAAIEYTRVDELVNHLSLDHRTGRFEEPTETAIRNELICFIGLGGGPSETGAARGSGRWGSAPYAEIEVNGKIVGRSRMLNSTPHLLAQTEARRAALVAAKTVTRIIVKEGIAYRIMQDAPGLGELVRLGLYLAEIPDTRRWETLPLYLQVARVSFPPDTTDFTVIFRHAGGAEITRRHITHPIARRGNRAIAFVREI